MRLRGLYPSGAFLLVLLGAVLFLLGRELGPLGRGTVRVASGDWVCLTDPEFGSGFHSIHSGQLLGPLVEKELPRVAVLFADQCRQTPLEKGTEIRLVRRPGSRERGCIVSPMPEGCRYLLGMPINVNRAREEELVLLPGIGPKLAKRILEVRESIGGFSSSEELLQVTGIGEKLLQKMEGRICF